MTNQEKYEILMSVKDNITRKEKIKRKNIKKFVSATKVRHEGLIDIIYSFLTLKENVFDYNISYKLSRYTSNTESVVISCGILSGSIDSLIKFFTITGKS